MGRSTARQLPEWLALSPPWDLHPERLRLRPVQAVQPLCFLRFVLEVERLRQRILHAEGQFVGLHTRRQRRVVGVLDGAQAVEAAGQVEVDALLVGPHVALGLAVVERVGGVDSQRHRVVGRAEVVAVLRVPVLAPADRDELRQVVVERAQAVMHPGAQRWVLAVEHVAAGVELRLGAVVVVGGVHRADDRQVIDALAQAGEPVADLGAALAVLLEADLQRVEAVTLLAVGVVDNDDAGQFQLFGVLCVLEWRLGDGLAGVLVECGLGVEGFQVADAAVHE
jgi:hypothetical protein